MLPDAATRAMLVEWRAAWDHLVDPPRLGLARNLPHTSIMQCPFFPERLTLDALQRIAGRMEGPLPRAAFTAVCFKPRNWIFLKYAPTSGLAALQGAALDILRDGVDFAAIERRPSYAGYTALESENYERWGYRYVGEAFAPHITLARLPAGAEGLPREIVEDFRERVAGRSFAFEALAFYEAGEGGAFARELARVPLPG